MTRDDPQTVLTDIRSPYQMAGGIDFTVNSDVPQKIREELMRLAISKNLSIYYLCAIYRQGHSDALKDVMQLIQALQDAGRNVRQPQRPPL